MKKDKLEQFFNQHLDQFEAPYDAGAWENISPQLDTSSGGTGAGSSILKWSVITIGTAAIIAGAVWLLLPTAEKSSTKQLQTEMAENAVSSDFEISTDQKTKQSLPISNDSERSIDAPSSHISNQNSANSNATVTTGSSDATAARPTVSVKDPASSTPPTSNPLDQAIAQGDETIQRKEFLPGVVSATFICSGEEVIIRNPHEKAYVRVLTEQRIYILEPGIVLSLSPETNTTIRFLDRKDEIISSIEINIATPTLPTIDVDANIYEDGLPVAKFRAYGDFKSISWDFGNGQTSSTPNTTAHYFDKGVYSVTISTTDNHGCITKSQEQVEIFEKYNLLATNSMRLNDVNIETRTFMPFCLKERQTPFSLTIIDPRDNAVIYTTKDFSKPWDGIDMRSGRLVSSNKTFIWQVQLEEPMPGERGIYKGTITVLE
jgi:hypothetical protein